MSEIAILSTGMVSSVGMTAASSCAAIRCAITGFSETQFMFAGERILGGEVRLEDSWSGRAKLMEMAVMAIEECLSGAGDLKSQDVPLLLCLPELHRPGRLSELDESFFKGIQDRIDISFHSQSAIFSTGRMGAVHAIEYAKKLNLGGIEFCLIVGVDSLLVGETLSSYDVARLILTAENSDGFIPGEAAAAILVGQPCQPWQQKILGIGFGTETASIDTEDPLKGIGLAQAIAAALDDAGTDFTRLHYRICDANGLQYAFKEASLALARVVRPTKPEFGVWHPADCIGEVGAAAVPTILVKSYMAAKKAYAPGNGVLCHFSSDKQERAALVLISE